MTRSTKEKVTVSVDAELLEWADQLVSDGVYESRSAAMEAALDALHARRADAQFVASLDVAKLDDVLEGIAIAEEGVEDWGASLDAMDGGWHAEGEHAAR